MDVPSFPASLIIFAGEPGDRRNGRQPPDAAHTPRPVMTRLPTANLIITFLFYYASAIARHQTPPFSFRFILVPLPPLPPPFFAPAHPHFAPTAAAVRFVSRRRLFFSPRRERGTLGARSKVDYGQHRLPSECVRREKRRSRAISRQRIDEIRFRNAGSEIRVSVSFHVFPFKFLSNEFIHKR